MVISYAMTYYVRNLFRNNEMTQTSNKEYPLRDAAKACDAAALEVKLHRCENVGGIAGYAE
jgi:hypothetical protein